MALSRNPGRHRFRAAGMRPAFVNALAVGAGGLVGSAARVGVSRLVPAPVGGFPLPTLLVNVIGSLLLGLYLVRREQTTAGAGSLRFWAIGVLGSFTTFSAFSLEVVDLVATGRGMTAGLYVLASVGGGLAAAMLGQRLAAR